VIGPLDCATATCLTFVRMHFTVFPSPALRAPIELAQHLVLGAVTFAGGLGCAPHPDFESARGHLGELREPCVITFGRGGRPLYIAGPTTRSRSCRRRSQRWVAMASRWRPERPRRGSGVPVIPVTGPRARVCA
jgi:hypothetical protein